MVFYLRDQNWSKSSLFFNLAIITLSLSILSSRNPICGKRSFIYHNIITHSKPIIFLLRSTKIHLLVQKTIRLLIGHFQSDHKKLRGCNLFFFWRQKYFLNMIIMLLILKIHSFALKFHGNLFILLFLLIPIILSESLKSCEHDKFVLQIFFLATNMEVEW